MMNYGCEVHGFDPSIDVPKQTEERQFIFHKIGLQGKDEVNANGWQMKTLRSIMKLLGHENRILDFIKLDIEESEYEAIPNMIETGVTEQIKQIALETHNFSMDEKDRQRYYYKYKQIWKLEKHGFIRFNSQAAMGTDRLNKIGNMTWVEILVFLSPNGSNFVGKPKPNTCQNKGHFKPEPHYNAEPLDIMRWHQWNNLGACKDLEFFGGYIWKGAKPNEEKMDGHKAVCLDNSIRPIPGDCLVYSFGIKDDWSFETAMLHYGCEVHGFDPSIDEPVQTGGKKFIFHKIGLQGKDEVNGNGWQLMSFKSIVELLGHENRIIDVVKMDIEESEYEAIPNMIITGVTGQIKQIALETHNWSMDEADRERYHYKYQQLWKLEKHGFVRFSSQPGVYTNRINNIANMSDFYAYELAWYNPKFYIE
ncbi:hypothetical protein QYM36_012288 [Artemia franciscana]|uniref:Methyltransferase domain-containing protein n=1 Tax=Artemia franciscana TaxID=6661 RepID=A0AA88HKH6_ARTSF|nr:hypothetical protein QYM36_012288 [Artemia franciscana]